MQEVLSAYDQLKGGITTALKQPHLLKIPSTEQPPASSMNEGDPAQQAAATQPPQTSTPPSAAMQEDSPPPPTTAAVLSSNGPSCPAAVTASSTIANEAELEAFSRTPAAERRMAPTLRGVLAEVALTGSVRYQWCLMRPLVDFALEQVRDTAGRLVQVK